MHKKFIKALSALFAASMLTAQGFALEIEDFRTDLYSKSGALKPIILSLDIIGDDLSLSKVLDSLNTVISGYFYEDIFTQSGKESLKNTLIKYSSKKHSLNIDEVLILSVRSLDDAALLDRLNELLSKSKGEAKD